MKHDEISSLGSCGKYNAGTENTVLDEISNKLSKQWSQVQFFSSSFLRYRLCYGPLSAFRSDSSTAVVQSIADDLDS